ncbi:M20 metallopeptidase family protein [Natronincola ferrireducens]|uniref:Amidohydrolase n=1 Tax=Natronincola ferrireducens TaxID=393762 RepID=A0A1G9E983_9FIRM|nr:M20 family metallopeptidase [Natronincola ferrireducens]SDK72690.1 amidohydrolase [Natronincola ferrireducens]
MREGIINMVDEVFKEIVEIRRDFHRYPELSEQEIRTSQKICEHLESFGIEYEKGIAQTGVVGIIRGAKPGKTVAIRADIDALPVTENNDIPYKSVNEGVMHACGHDLHASILLGAAKLLKSMESQLKGNVKFFFQPAEETVGGAKPMVEEGCMKNPDVDYIIGLHVMPYMPTGWIEVRRGKLNAASNEFYVKVKGVSSHGAYPEKSVDSLLTACNIVNALQTIVSRNTSPLNSVVLSVGKFNAGTCNNIIPGEATFSGIFRTLDPLTRQQTKDRIQEICENTAKAYGASVEVRIEDGYAFLINDDDVLDVIISSAEDLIGEERIQYKEYPSLGVEDFSFFNEVAKGAFFHLGCGFKGEENPPLHNDQFLPDETCMKYGIALEVMSVLKLLER